MTRNGCWHWLVQCLVLAWMPAWIQGAGLLPVYVEESHAGTFYHLAELLSGKEPHTLILLDAHSDASAIAGSDDIRKALNAGGGRAALQARLDGWREQGRIQCFDWIEPLMPARIGEVIWVPALKLAEVDRSRLEAEAREFLDGHEEALPRDAGPLAHRYRVLDFEGLQKEMASWRPNRKVVASVDLDFFAGFADEEMGGTLEGILDAVLKLRGLSSLSFAISSPYLRDAGQAEKLAFLALESAFRIANAEVQFESMARTGPDRSLMARLLERKGERLPALDLQKAGPALRSLLLRQWQTGDVRHGRAEIEHSLAEWGGDAFLPGLQRWGGMRREDGGWSFEAGAKGGLALQEKPVGARVRWWALRCKESRYHVGDTDFGFASGTPAWLFQEKVLLAEGAGLGELPLAQISSVLHPQHGCGSTEVFAEVIQDGQSRVTQRQKVHVRMAGTKGTRAAWSEQFMLPYVFDSRLLLSESGTGPEAGLGADCANFITHGLRREGWRLPWGNPRDLLPWLKKADTIPAAEPTLLYFGNHLAAVWQDLPPVGQLNDADLCVHQLEGPPEILELSRLKAGRPVPQMMRLTQPKKTVKLIFAGDVMLGRGVRPGPAAQSPFARLAPWLSTADAVIGNLECVIGSLATHEVPAVSARHKLLAAPVAASWLKDAGFKVVSVANNHASDFGEAGKAETLRHLEQPGVLAAAACKPVRWEIQGLRLSLLAWDDSAEPDDGLLVEQIHQESEVNDVVWVMPHWGREHQTGLTPRQILLARRWLAAGAHWIIGSGPHCVQSFQQYPRGGVAYSLGNAVFDGRGPDEEWSRGAWLEITFDAESKVAVRARLVRTVFDEQGQVRMQED